MDTFQQPSLLEKALDVLRTASSGRPFPTQAALARAMGESEANISRWLSGSSTPTLKKLEPILLRLGVRLALPQEVPVPPEVTIRAFSADEETAHELDFTTVPLVGEVGAGGAMLPLDNQPIEWIVTPLQGRESADVLAMRVARHEHSMLPSIYPGDTVIIDRHFCQQPTSNEIYLVQEPPSEGSGYLLKRVCLKTVLRRTVVILYSDNAKEGYAPLVYDLALYPEGSLREIIKGRVTHVWSELRRR